MESRYDMQNMIDKSLLVFAEDKGVALSVTGTFMRDGGAAVLVVDGTEQILPIEGLLPAGCKDGDKVAAFTAGGVAMISEVYGSSDEAEPNIKALLNREGMNIPFEAEALMQSKATAFTEISALIAKRTDLRGKTILTLSETDNSRTECGFSVEQDGEGNYVLGIHTADVAEFIEPASALESAVFSRHKTAVLPDKEIPMLPDSLTKGPCFLEVGEDRLAVSYFLTIDEDGRVKSFEFCESVIKTAANCLFSEIEALFLDYDTSAIMPLRKAYASVLPAIANMFNLGAILQNARVMRGGADIDRAERRFVCSRHGGRPIGITFRKDSDPKRLVREFLSVAGQELASYLYGKGIPAVYRVQEEPSAEAIAAFCNNAKAVGIDTDTFEGTNLFAWVADCARGIREEELLLYDMHSILPETGFSDKPHRHFIHGTDMYVRFAYPLNRCADYCIQRIVKGLIAEGATEALIERCKALNVLAVSSATAERRTNRVEKAVMDLVALDCMRRDKNKAYTGLVHSVNDDVAIVLLDNGCIGYLSLEGASDKSEFCFGTEVSVQFDRADMKAGKLYLKF